MEGTAVRPAVDGDDCARAVRAGCVPARDVESRTARCGVGQHGGDVGVPQGRRDRARPRRGGADPRAKRSRRVERVRVEGQRARTVQADLFRSRRCARRAWRQSASRFV